MKTHNCDSNLAVVLERAKRNPHAIIDVLHEVKAIEQTPCRNFRITFKRGTCNPFAVAHRVDYFTYRNGLKLEPVHRSNNSDSYALVQKRRTRHV